MLQQSLKQKEAHHDEKKTNTYKEGINTTVFFRRV
jgi:hypothetical protein